MSFEQDELFGCDEHQLEPSEIRYERDGSYTVVFENKTGKKVGEITIPLDLNEGVGVAWSYEPTDAGMVNEWINEARNFGANTLEDRHRPTTVPPILFVSSKPVDDAQENLRMAEEFKRDNPLWIVPAADIAAMISSHRSGGKICMSDASIQRAREDAPEMFAGFSDDEVRERIRANMNRVLAVIVKNNPQVFKEGT